MEPTVKKLKVEDNEKMKKVEKVLQEYVLSDDTIQRIVDAFEEQARLANSKDEDERKKSDLFWECTYITKLLTGDEDGIYLGLDLGGTHFRVVWVEFDGSSTGSITKYYNLPDELYTGKAERVFDHIAESMDKFFREEKITADKPIPVGFTFSFPSIQKSVKNSVLTSWTKTFKCTTGVGSDPCIMLEEAIQRRGGLSLPVEIVTRLNDTVATFMAGTHECKQCCIGMIIGTGSNACFVEYVKNFNNLNPDEVDSDQVVLDTEWQSFGDGGCIDFMKTDLDKEVDKHSNHPGEATFEKMFSGLYLGELVRLVLVKLTNDGLLFGGRGSEQIFKRNGFDTKYVTAIESDEDDSTGNTKEMIKDMGLEGIASDEDISVVRQVCSVISQRGAYCIAAATAVLLYHINRPVVTIAVDGSLFEHHPKYKKHMLSLLAKLVPKTKVDFIFVKDGSGSGAAFAAAAMTQ